MTSSLFSIEVAFSDLQEDFLRLTTEIGWCSTATIDHKDRPRSRVMHVSWEVADGRPVGWVCSARTPVKTAHLARNPYVSCSYWSPDHDAVFADCAASWADDAGVKQRRWDIVAAEALARGFDPYAQWPGGVDDPGFHVLRLDPWRVQVTLQDLEHGKTIGSSRVWHATA